MEPVAEFASCRISYLHEMLPPADRQEQLRDQYYFTCTCPLCAGRERCELGAGLLRCPDCDAPVPFRESMKCKKCLKEVSREAVEQYGEMVQRLAKPEGEPDILHLYEQSKGVAHPWDRTQIQLTELAMKAALDRGEVRRFYALGQTLHPIYQSFFHPSSVSLGLYWAKLAKAAFFVGEEEKEAGVDFLRKALAICSLTYGQNHPYFQYLLQLGPSC